MMLREKEKKGRKIGQMKNLPTCNIPLDLATTEPEVLSSYSFFPSPRFSFRLVRSLAHYSLCHVHSSSFSYTLVRSILPSARPHPVR